MKDITTLLNSIPSTESDKLLCNWGYNFAAEYFEILSHASLISEEPVLELATGTGRMSAVLTRLGYYVVTGDVSMKDRFQAEIRIGKKNLHKVKFLMLNMELLPFNDGSFSTVISMNTFHHLEHPEICLREIIRVHSGKNPLIIGDFNETGFIALQKVHQILYRKDHPCGSFNMKQLKSFLELYYHDVKEFCTNLNLTYIASGKNIT